MPAAAHGRGERGGTAPGGAACSPGRCRSTDRSALCAGGVADRRRHAPIPWSDRSGDLGSRRRSRALALGPEAPRGGGFPIRGDSELVAPLRGDERAGAGRTEGAPARRRTGCMRHRRRPEKRGRPEGWLGEFGRHPSRDRRHRRSGRAADLSRAARASPSRTARDQLVLDHPGRNGAVACRVVDGGRALPGARRSRRKGRGRDFARALRGELPWHGRRRAQVSGRH